MPRPRSFEEDEALDAALLVFWRQGYEATSIQELVDATGLSRSSLYAAFGDKHGLFLRCLERYGETVGADWTAPLRDPSAGLPEIRRCFELMLELIDAGIGRMGCFNVVSLAERGPHDPDVADLTQANFRMVREAFRAALGAAAARGELPAEADLEAHADHLAVSFQGLMLQARSGAPVDIARAYTRLTLSTLPAPPSPLAQRRPE